MRGDPRLGVGLSGGLHPVLRDRDAPVPDPDPAKMLNGTGYRNRTYFKYLA